MGGWSAGGEGTDQSLSHLLRRGIHLTDRIELLEDMGVKVSRPQPNTVILQADGIDPDYFNTHAFKKKSGKLRGTVHQWRGVPLVVTYHPAYLLRQPADKAKAWDDLCLAAGVMGQPGSG